MITKIGSPSEFSDTLKNQIIDLVANGEQVSKENIEYGLNNADLIAILLDGDTIVTTATLKNPRLTYRNAVFEWAGLETKDLNVEKELGYITTRPDYEGEKRCQRLLIEFLPMISNQNIFATTRKKSMMHILSKFDFKQTGNCYKEDLYLFTRTQ